MERVTGIEPVTEAWEAFVIPFHHTRGDATEVTIPRAAVKPIRPARDASGSSPTMPITGVG